MDVEEIEAQRVLDGAHIGPRRRGRRAWVGAIEPKGVLVIIRESWAASPEDEEVVASAKVVPGWLRGK